MSVYLTLPKAIELMEQYNQEPFHRYHAQVVSGVLGYFAKEYDPENEEFWRVVGMLHDLDFELYPEQHCLKAQQMMKELDLEDRLIHAMMSHGYGLTTDVMPENTMEKILYATDELTGLIGACAKMRPSRSVSDMEVKSLRKKYKTPSFAAGCSRGVIANGAEMLGWTLDELFEKTIHAMQSLIGVLDV